MIKIFILTGTRADWGKLQYLTERFVESKNIDVQLIISGMHLSEAFGSTFREIEKKFPTIKKHYVSNLDNDFISGAQTFSLYEEIILTEKPDYVFIHGDRLEPLIMATVCCINSIPTFHMEGGEYSGTQDEMFRHAISKLASFHLPANENAASQLISMGEDCDRILTIGSLDLEYVEHEHLPDFDELKKRYEIPFSNYTVLSFHPVTTDESETLELSKVIKKIPSALPERNFIVILPNNDKYNNHIYDACEYISKNTNVLVFPSIRFEFYLTLLKNSDVLIGNSSAGIREMPSLGKPTINIGTRQNNRDTFDLPSIRNIDANHMFDIRKLIIESLGKKFDRSYTFTVPDVARRLKKLEKVLLNKEIRIQK